jgi:Second Messenger Oligonucleotide or Dinucleotide Synthetase domain
LISPQLALTKEAEDYLEDLAEELRVSDTRYEQAARSYKSLGDWLHRSASSVRNYGPQVYVQGSFRLGTTIKPLNEAEEYDVDSVCELASLTKQQLSQAQLKALLGAEIEAYRRSQNMVKPLREGRRCWVLDYADGAQFHMDVVPSLPNGLSQRTLLEAKGHDSRWAMTAIGITDREVWNFEIVSDDWPRSNPKGYAEWFKSRMAAVFERRRRMIAEKVHAKVEDIPDYRVMTPLQSAIMILKRHRDHMFVDRSDVRPISVIITTLSAHAYNGEETIGQALLSILTRMDDFIFKVGSEYLIPNPTDALENFADKWKAYPDRAVAFFEWLRQAREDFRRAATLVSRQMITESIARGVGSVVAERARIRRGIGPAGLLMGASTAPASSKSGFAFPDRPRVPTKPQGFA